MNNSADKKISAIILAAGQGKRMHSDVQKQYMLLKGKPVLYYSIEAFEKSNVEEIILVTGAGQEEYCRKEIVEAYGFEKVKKIVCGGKERYDSVYQGLLAAEGDAVLIHDGARPLVTVEIIEKVAETLTKENACVVGMPVKDTIKLTDEDGFVADTPPRDRLWMVQTPQGFAYPVIRKAHEEYRSKMAGKMQITDDAMMVERILGQAVKLVEGSYSNIKVTTPEDIYLAETLLDCRFDK